MFSIRQDVRRRGRHAPHWIMWHGEPVGVWHGADVGGATKWTLCRLTWKKGDGGAYHYMLYNVAREGFGRPVTIHDKREMEEKTRTYLFHLLSPEQLAQYNRERLERRSPHLLALLERIKKHLDALPDQLSEDIGYDDFKDVVEYELKMAAPVEAKWSQDIVDIWMYEGKPWWHDGPEPGPETDNAEAAA